MPPIKAGVEKLGFKMSDTKLLLATHGHFDHVAGPQTCKNDRSEGCHVEKMSSCQNRRQKGFRFMRSLARFPSKVTAS